MQGTPTDPSVRTVLRHYVWREPSGPPVPGTAAARVRRGQIYVALVGAALWLGGLLGGILAEGGAVVWCLGIVTAVGLGTLMIRPPETAVLTATLLVTAVVVLVSTRAQEAGSPLGTGWFDTAAVSLIGIATLRRAVVWATVIGVTSLATWSFVVATATVPGGWRTAVAWSVSSVSLGLTSAVMAAIIRAGARRLDQTLASAQQVFTDEELQQAETAEFDAAARVLHDSVINTLAAIGRGMPSDVAALRLRCRQDLDLIDTTLADETPPDEGAEPVATARARARALGLDLSVTGTPDALSQLSPAARDAIGGAIAESLLNAAKYARVPAVTLDVAAAADEAVVVTVSDEGSGWSGSVPPGGGVDQSILARCRAVGVDARVDTSPGRGTTVTLRAVRGASASNGEAVFVAESRIMTALVCGVLLVDMGIRTVLGEGLLPSWGSAIAYLLLVAAMVWPWFGRFTRVSAGPLAPLTLALVGLPVVLLLPIEEGALSWIWWGTVAGIAIFLALVAMNASAWWVLLAYALQMGGRYVAADQTFALLIPDSVAVGLGALVALWIRARVLRLMSETAVAARERDDVRLQLLRHEAGQAESLLRLRQATDVARRPLELIASGERTGTEDEVRAQAAALAPYLRNVSRVGPGLGVVASALIRVLDEGRNCQLPITMNIDPSATVPGDPGAGALMALLADTADRLDSTVTCTVSLLSRPGGALLTVVTSEGAPSEAVIAVIRSAGMQVTTDTDDSATWTEVTWDDRTGGIDAEGRVHVGDMVP